MRRMVPALLFAVLSVLPASGLAAPHYDTHVMDGDDWLTWGPVTKTAFVEGFKAGTGYVIQSGDGALNLPLPESYDVRKAEMVQKEFQDVRRLPEAKQGVTFSANDVILLMTHRRAERKQLMLDLGVAGYSTELIVEGIDALYGQYENRHIKVQDAVYYARKKIDKIPGPELARIVNYLRSDKEESGWLVVYDEKGQVKKFITFP